MSAEEAGIVSKMSQPGTPDAFCEAPGGMCPETAGPIVVRLSQPAHIAAPGGLGSNARRLRARASLQGDSRITALHGRGGSRRVGCHLPVLVLVLGCLCAPAFAQKMVFAHYMVTNQDYQGNTDPTQEAKITAYEREIQQAQAAGIDGFALNVGGWRNQNYYIVYSAQMFEAAAPDRRSQQVSVRELSVVVAQFRRHQLT